MNKSESIKNLATALHKAQGQIKHAVKDSKNPFFKSSYADLVSVWDAIRDAFQANGLSISQMPDMDGDKPVLTSILMHTSGEYLESRILLNPAKNDPQGIGSCVSYFRRYALQSIAGVCADDDDGEAAHGRAKEAAKVVAPKIPNPLSDAFKAATAKGRTKAELLLLASKECGHEILGAADIQADEIGKVVAAWELMVAYEAKP